MNVERLRVREMREAYQERFKDNQNGNRILFDWRQLLFEDIRNGALKNKAEEKNRDDMVDIWFSAQRARAVYERIVKFDVDKQDGTCIFSLIVEMR